MPHAKSSFLLSIALYLGLVIDIPSWTILIHGSTTLFGFVCLFQPFLFYSQFSGIVFAVFMLLVCVFVCAIVILDQVNHCKYNRLNGFSLHSKIRHFSPGLFFREHQAETEFKLCITLCNLPQDI